MVSNIYLLAWLQLWGLGLTGSWFLPTNENCWLYWCLDPIKCVSQDLTVDVHISEKYLVDPVIDIQQGLLNMYVVACKWVMFWYRYFDANDGHSFQTNIYLVVH